jgi:heavy metal sensor kinase
MPQRLIRGLRFRLAFSYAIFFAILLAGFGFVLRGMLRNVVETTVQGLLDEEWAALKGFLVIDTQGHLIWNYDPTDKEESLIVERLRQVYMIADSKGEVLENSNVYLELGFESPAEIQRVLRQDRPSYAFRSDSAGRPFMIRRGVLREKQALYYVGLGRNYAPSNRVIEEFSFNYFAALPLIILTAAGLGWLLARSAMQPVSQVAEQVSQVTGKNLSLRVPLRGAGDELDHMITAFNTMVERLETSFHQVRQFSTDVSHELRTPITVVRGQLEVALMTATTEEELRLAIEAALVDIERLSQIVRALLNLAKAESGQLALNEQPVDLVHLIREVCGELEIHAADREVNLRFQLPRWGVILGDRIQMERLLYNLIDNGIKYNKAGGLVTVSLRLSETLQELILEVRDNGKGIATEHLPHLFDRFYRVPGNDSVGEKGLGLGLSFVSWIVKAHHGDIQVASEAGVGTCFTITLPAAAAESRNLADHANEPETEGRHLHIGS